ncbi:MAG: tail fiber domain-containing protein [Bacteroidota bacterium]
MYYITQNIKKFSLFFFASIITSVAFSQTAVTDSDIKMNISEINDPLQKITKLKPKVFEYNTQKYKHLKLDQGQQFGFMAENVKEVFPNLVAQKKVSYMFGKNTYRDTNVNVVDEASLIPVLVASIQQQQEQIKKLTADIELLKNKRTVTIN